MNYRGYQCKKKVENSCEFLMNIAIIIELQFHDFMFLSPIPRRFLKMELSSTQPSTKSDSVIVKTGLKKKKKFASAVAKTNVGKVRNGLPQIRKVLNGGRTKVYTKTNKKTDLQKLQDSFRGYDVDEILLADPVATREHRSRVAITDIDKAVVITGKKHALITEDVS
jgi:hypothetical protein